MKSCPVCKHNYEDDTLFFCLEDGTQLSGVDAPGGLTQRNAYPAATEILPPGPVEARVQSLTQPQQQTTNQSRGKSGSGPWIVVGGILAGGLVLLMGVGGYFVWRASRQPTEPAQVLSPIASTNSTSSNSNVKSQAVAAPAPQATPTPNWIDGVWEGKGFQTDTNTSWSVRLTIRDNNFAVEYPDIPCSGVWSIVNQTSTGGTFKEIIRKNVSICANNSSVLLQRVSESEMLLKYSHENSRAVTATATLRKRAAKKS